MSAYRVFVGCRHWIQLDRKIVVAVNHGLVLVFVFVIIIAAVISFYAREVGIIVFLIVFVGANFIGFTFICARAILVFFDFAIATFHVIASIICANVGVANFG